MLLNENLFEEIIREEEEVPAVETEVVTDSEIKPEGPEQGEDTGIANLIHDLIIDVNTAIQNYNNAAANMESYPELQKVMQEIAGEEFTFIGKLEKALEVVSPNAANIEEGEVETEENLAETEIPVDESLTEGVRDTTNKLLAAVENGSLDINTVLLAALKYMSEDEVTDMCRMNEFDLSDEIEESLEETILDSYQVVDANGDLLLIKQIGENTFILERITGIPFEGESNQLTQGDLDNFGFIRI